MDFKCKTVKYFQQRGKLIGAGLATIRLAGAGVGVKLFVNLQAKFPKIICGFTQMFYFYCTFILYVRSFFLIERPWFIYSFLILFWTIKFYLYLSITYYISILLYLGINLIVYDNLGSLIAQHGTGTMLTTFLVSTRKSPNILIRHIVNRSMSALIIGKTAMTATGRAAIMVGCITGAGYLYNDHLNRVHDATQRELIRGFEATQQDLNRGVEREKIAIERDKYNLEREKFEASKKNTSWWPFKPKG